MTILERLADEEPKGHTLRGYRQEKVNKIRELIAKHFDELEAARRSGYSISQIGRAAEAAWIESGEWPFDTATSIRGVTFENCYRDLRQEAEDNVKNNL